jgi:hypothetical protein
MRLLKERGREPEERKD